MNNYVINLDRRPDRLERFLAENDDRGIEFTRYVGVDGPALDPAALRSALGVSSGAPLPYAASAAGCVLSHLLLWKRIAAGSEPTTVCEDDAVLRADFAAHLNRVTPKLSWDLILWGWNFDSPVLLEGLPGIAATVQFDQGALRRNVEKFRQATGECVLVPLRWAYGTPCYSITPEGACKFLDVCQPLLSAERFATTSGSIPNLGIDTIMSVAYSCTPAYGQTKSYAAIPPLVATRNEP